MPPRSGNSWEAGAFIMRSFCLHDWKDSVWGLPFFRSFCTFTAYFFPALMTWHEFIQTAHLLRHVDFLRTCIAALSAADACPCLFSGTERWISWNCIKAVRNSHIVRHTQKQRDTPLEETFSFPVQDAIVFTGSADPWVEAGRIPALCKESGIPCRVIPNANHSLETADPVQDILTLQKIMSLTEQYMAK